MKHLWNRLLRTVGVDVIKFAVVGAISTCIDFGLLNIFVWLGANIYLALCIAYLIGAVNGYLLNNQWTYRRLERVNTFSGFLRYTVISFVGLGLTEGIVFILSHELHANLNFDKLVAVFIVFAWNFFANRHFTFQVAPKQLDAKA